jgi:hypothetical protein
MLGKRQPGTVAMDEVWGRMGKHTVDGHYSVCWCLALERVLFLA